ncbi:YebC/PmpR family DNA-binding transcriptional regulator [bacterium]|nr:YebC/PmpR family DNA-binding transcriptional regulator [bacterium]
MSGHSKWATIKRKKAKEDAKRGQAFTKVSKEITIAAREGGGDPDGNSRLRLLLDKAKSVNMPNDNIIRAIKRGTGELGGAMLESVLYEGYGPHGVALMVESLTDNKTRTVASLRHFFRKRGGHLAEGGAVAWMFEHQGVVTVDALEASEDSVLEELLNYDIDDVKKDGDVVVVTCDSHKLDLVRKGAESHGFAVQSAELVWAAKEPVSVDDGSEKQVFQFLEDLEEIDDVQNVFANVG